MYWTESPSYILNLMTNALTTTYLGLRLRNPLVVAACPLTAEPDTLRRMEELGAAAAVMPSLFEEQISPVAPTVNRPPHLGPESFDEGCSFITNWTTTTADPQDMSGKSS
jgi:dihydroorotate dehydrogenase (fumarate)